MTMTLFVVGTPIGNRGDLGPRARACLESVDLVLAEDTRVVGRLCHLLDIKPRAIRGYQGRQRITESEFVDVLATGDIALVSDAGMPGISDPGAAFVALALARGAKVSPIPGPSVLTAALALWPLSFTGACFYGFLPRRGQERIELLRRLMAAPTISVLLESPRRLRDTCADLAAIDGSRRTLLLGELTKLHESVHWMTLSEAHSWLTTVELKGEWAVVVDQASTAAPPQQDGERLLVALARSSLGTKEAAGIFAEVHDLGSREAYRLMLSRRTDGQESS